jgi:predicted RND superfamily exporter protein
MSAAGPRSGAPSLLACVVAACARHAWLTLAVAAALAAGAYAYTARHIAIDTDTTRLIAEDVPWRQRELVFDAAFP